MDWATFWATFLQTHLATLTPSFNSFFYMEVGEEQFVKQNFDLSFLCFHNGHLQKWVSSEGRKKKKYS
jgi:hypothetical protein